MRFPVLSSIKFLSATYSYYTSILLLNFHCFASRISTVLPVINRSRNCQGSLSWTFEFLLEFIKINNLTTRSLRHIPYRNPTGRKILLYAGKNTYKIYQGNMAAIFGAKYIKTYIDVCIYQTFCMFFFFESLSIFLMMSLWCLLPVLLVHALRMIISSKYYHQLVSFLTSKNFYYS